MNKTIFYLILLLCFPSFLMAQELQVTTRLNYYTHETFADFIAYGEGIEDVFYIEPNTRTKIDFLAPKDYRLFTVDISELPVGEHLFEFDLSLKDNQVISVKTTLRRLPSHPNEVKIDRLTNGLIVNDTPFFPFGFYTGFPPEKTLQQEVYNYMNVVGVYQSNEVESLEERKAYMDLCASLGIKVNYGLNSLVGKGHNKTDEVLSSEEQQRREMLLRKEVETFKDHPALLAWYMNDEPIGQSRPPELLENAYNIISKIDPYHPVSVVFVIPEKADAFANTMDIAMTDPYPIPGDVNAVRGHMAQLNKHFRFKKSLWIVPQAFGGGEFWSREPTGAEIRIMTYLAVLDGAMGVQYFIRRYPNLFPKSRLAWNEAVKVAHEIQMLMPWLSSGKVRRNLTPENDALVVTAFEKTDSYLILVANGKNEPTTISLDLPFSRIESDVSVLFKNRKLTLEANSLSDQIDGFDVQAYVIPKQQLGKKETKNNLFINQGFESFSSAGLPMGTYARSENQPNYDGATYFLDGTVAKEGNYSLRFNNPNETSNQQLHFFRNFLLPNQTYRVSFWAKSSPLQPSLPFNITIENLAIEHTFTATPEWQEFSFYFSATEQVKEASLGVHATHKGTFWIDEIVLTPDPQISVNIYQNGTATVSIESQTPNAKLSYALNDAPLQPYSSSFVVSDYTELRVALTQGNQVSQETLVTIPLSRATFKKATFETPYSAKYQASGANSILDGVFGSLDFRDKKWLGFDGKDVVFTIDLEEIASFSQVTAHFLVSVDDGIHAPRSMNVEVSKDGKRWQKFGTVKNAEGSLHGEGYYLTLPITSKTTEARYIRFTVSSPKVIPNSYLFSGTDAWIFIDEVMVQ